MTAPTLAFAGATAPLPRTIRRARPASATMVVAAPATTPRRRASRTPEKKRTGPAVTNDTSVAWSRARADAGDGGLLAYLKEIGTVDLLEGHEVVECARHMRNLLRWENVKDEMDARRREESDSGVKKSSVIAARYRFTKPKIRAVSAVTMEEWASAVDMDLEDFRRDLNVARSYKNRLVSANLRLVVSIAKKYTNNGVSLSDLIQEGSIGLIRGAEKFDHTKGFRFATYASWWIRQAIQRAISDSSRAIRLPTHVSDTAKKAGRVRREFERENNRPPTTEEVADILNIKPDRLNFILKKAAETNTLSLDVPMFPHSTDRKSVSLGDLIEDDGIAPEDAVAATLLRDDIENVLLMLSPREREVLRMRYGFDDGKSKNFEEIGAIYCVPPNRIRQIEARAIRKLRHPNFHRCLTDWCVP